MSTESASDRYDGANVQLLTGLGHIRKRPVMYLGDVQASGLHHLVYELVYNSIEEVLAGFGSRIDVTIRSDGSVTVADEGRGIADFALLSTILCPGPQRRLSCGIRGIGAKAVNALSEWMTAETHRDGRMRQQRLTRGEVVGDVVDLGPMNQFVPQFAKPHWGQ